MNFHASFICLSQQYFDGHHALEESELLSSILSDDKENENTRDWSGSDDDFDDDE